MDIGFIGLGEMGGNMAQRLAHSHHRVVGFDSNETTLRELARQGIEPVVSLEALGASLQIPRTLWLMIPAGEPVDRTIDALLPLLTKGDVIVDGGNSHYKDSLQRSAMVQEARIDYVDCGTSGGVWGLTEGYSLMVGGDAHVVERLRPLFEILATAGERGWGRVGPSGSGHFSKMIHNGIE